MNNSENKPPSLPFFKYDLAKLIFMSEKKNYKVVHREYKSRPTPLRIKINDGFLPFGIEQYANKYILNIELKNHKKNNIMYNTFVELNNFDNFMKQFGDFMSDNKELKKLFIYDIPDDLLNKFKGKNYVSCLKIRQTESKEFDPHFRVHLKSKKDKICNVFYDKDGNFIDFNKLKGTTGSFNIEIGSIWFTSTSYGFTYYLVSV